MPADDTAARPFRVHDRATVARSTWCGCRSCLHIFPPAAITEWVNRDGRTPICPNCSVDALVGVGPGQQLTRAMVEEWGFF